MKISRGRSITPAPGGSHEKAQKEKESEKTQIPAGCMDNLRNKILPNSSESLSAMKESDPIELILERMKKHLEGLGDSILDIKKARIAADEAQKELSKLRGEI